jgi:hypothetical protein
MSIGVLQQFVRMKRDIGARIFKPVDASLNARGALCYSVAAAAGPILVFSGSSSIMKRA